MAYAPLHEHAFICVRVVGRPEFMMLPHGSIVGAASSGGTGLEYHIREFRRQRLKNTFIAPHVVNGQIPLAAGIQPGRAGVGNFAVAIPFDIGNTRMPPKQLPHGIKNVPAYMRIAQVQQILAAFQPVFPTHSGWF